MRLIDADALPVVAECCMDEAGYLAKFNVVHEEDIKKAPTVNALVLPCKVGDTVYSKDGKAAEIEEFIVDNRDIMAMVSFQCNYDCKDCAFNSWHTEYSGESSCDGEYGTAIVSLEDFGKTVFLTREEAEAALAKMNGGENDA